MSQAQPPSAAPTRPASAFAVLTPRVATSVMFYINGLVIATLVVRIPSLRDALHLSDAQVGTAILGMAVGALLSMPLSGGWIARWGSSAVTRLAGVLLCLSLILPFLAGSLPMLFVCLAVLGLSNGAMDVAMNAHGVAVERRLEKPVMSSFHAWFSLGGLSGALLGSLILALQIPALGHALGLLLVALVVVVLAGFSLLPASADQQTAPQQPTAEEAPAPRRSLSPLVIPMGLLCFLGMLGEGASGDWSGLYYRDVLKVSGGLVGLGYTALTLSMTVGRVFGDRWRSRFGDARLVVASGLLSGVGVLVAVLSHSYFAATLGYALTGLGVANIVPVLYGVAGRAMSGRGIARVATLGYMGFLAGPPLIGYVAHAFNLRSGLLVIAVSLLAVAALATWLFARLERGDGAVQS
ncbi:MFS transporter [Deinococcus ruber]|uniref:MFS transporter n=1 Tax=Deinococcus ruber TaxID=1848197 RepID=A0A918F0P9_9DEIO|nr:MFS transporter [Deinococcus ruber]GGQ97201.1 MFS transporter [Deinococcus ruber]